MSAALIAGAFGASTPGSAQATAFTVNSTVDAVDANPGDGICETGGGGGECTLRAAIQEANAVPGPDSIDLPAGNYPIATGLGLGEDAAASGDLDITDDLEIRGSGAATAVIEGGEISDLGFRETTFEIKAVTVVMSELTIMNGGEPLIVGGGILNDGGNLTLNDVVVRENMSRLGAGIASSGTLTVNGGLFFGNGVSGSQSAAGALFNVGTMTLDGVTFSSNRAANAGAVLNLGEARLMNVTVEKNGGTLFAATGAIENLSNMTLTNSTVRDSGLTGIFSSGTLIVSNSTISGNGLVGIYNRGTATITNATITGNAATETGFGGGIYNDAATLGAALTLRNTVVAANIGGDCGGPTPVVSEGHNLSSDDTCPFTAPGDLVNTDPLLGPLADNGGPTQTHVLLPGSPAIDAGDDAGCPATDQRGFARPADGDGDGVAVCDIGAYELEPQPCPADVNADGVVDSRDVRLVARSLHSEPGSRRWNQAADLNGDRRVDPTDLHIVLRARKSRACA